MIDINGVILLGGKSTRMGKDKKYLLYKEKTFLETTILLLKNLKCNRLILSGNIDSNSYKVDPTIIEIPDMTPNCGPLGGIYSVLTKGENNKWFLFLPVDMPFLNQQIITYLVDSLKGTNFSPNLIYYKDYVFPFLLKNTSEICSLVKTHLDNNIFSLKKLFNLLNSLTLSLPPNLKATLTNINTIKDYLNI